MSKAKTPSKVEYPAFLDTLKHRQFADGLKQAYAKHLKNEGLSPYEASAVPLNVRDIFDVL